MYILEVIPLTNLPQNGPQILSYFSDGEMPKGSVVGIAVNNRKIKGVVISSNPLEKEKAALKKSLYQLKKITNIVSASPLVGENQFKIALWIAKTYYAPLGLSLKHVLPPFWGKNKYPSEPVNSVNKDSENGFHIILANTKDVPARIEPMIRDAVDDGQAMIILPDKEYIPAYVERLSRVGITAVIQSGLTNQEYFNSWQSVSDGRTQILIGTRSALLAQFKNLKLIIVVDSHNEMYASDMAPKFHAAELASYVAGINRAKLIYADVFEGVINYHAARSLDDKRKRDREVVAVDMVRELQSGNFWSISNALRKAIIDTLNANEKILLFSPRKGYMGLLVCGNCGASVKCSNCDVPMRVHQSINLTLVCHHCMSVKSLPGHCANCNSAKLKPAGPAGSQRIYEEIYALKEEGKIRDAPVVVIDADVTQNETEEKEVIETLLKPGPAVCVATQGIFSFLPYLNFDCAGVINGDSLMNMPDYRSEEKFIHVFEKISDFNPKKIILQAYHRDNPLLDLLPDGNYEKFYLESLILRSRFMYPPYSKLILLSYSHRDWKKASTNARILNEKLKMALAHSRIQDIVRLSESSPAYISKEKGLYRYHILIKVKPEFENIREFLKYVPNQWKISVNPVNLI